LKGKLNNQGSIQKVNNKKV